MIKIISILAAFILTVGGLEVLYCLLRNIKLKMSFLFLCCVQVCVIVYGLTIFAIEKEISLNLITVILSSEFILFGVLFSKYKEDLGVKSIFEVINASPFNYLSVFHLSDLYDKEKQTIAFIGFVENQLRDQSTLKHIASISVKESEGISLRYRFSKTLDLKAIPLNFDTTKVKVEFGKFFGGNTIQFTAKLD